MISAISVIETCSPLLRTARSIAFFTTPGPGNTDADHGIGFADAQITAGHERHIFRDIAEDNQLAAAETVAISSCGSNIQHSVAHQLHCIHIDAGAGAPDVDGRANVIGCCQSFGQRVNQVSLLPGVMPFSTKAPKPPKKSTPASVAQSSKSLQTLTI